MAIIAGMPSDLMERTEALERITRLYGPERYVYMAACILSFVTLIGCAIYLLLTGDKVISIGLFGSSGGIMLSSGAMLYMWNKSVAEVFGK